VPIEERVVADLWLSKEKTPYGAANDWIFPSNRNQGKAPCWPGVVMQKVIRPAALRAGIRKKIGWHTFRHTYSTLLITNGEKVKVVQELMRHASSRFTLEIYSQAQLIAKRQAQQRLVQVLFLEESDRMAPLIEGQLESNYLSHNQ
jgi:site-specific recombinase XerD